MGAIASWVTAISVFYMVGVMTYLVFAQERRTARWRKRNPKKSLPPAFSGKPGRGKKETQPTLRDVCAGLADWHELTVGAEQLLLEGYEALEVIRGEHLLNDEIATFRRRISSLLKALRKLEIDLAAFRTEVMRARRERSAKARFVNVKGQESVNESLQAGSSGVCQGR